MSMLRILAVATAMTVAQPATAQSLAERAAAAGDGPVTFSFASRPEVCGDGEHFVRIGRSSYMGSGASWRNECRPGPVQVRLTMREGRVERIESWVGAVHAREGRSLGAVPAAEAARYLLVLAARAEG